MYSRIVILWILSVNAVAQSLYGNSQNFESNSIRQKFDPELSKITNQIGHDVILDCGINDNKSDYSSKSPVVWHYKPCGHGFNQTSCQNAIESQDPTTWAAIKCVPSNRCNASLLITNPSERDSGLYKCSAHQVENVYFLDVRNTTISPPDILDGQPSNTSAAVDSQVVLQCCVHSSVRPSIFWYRRQEDATTATTAPANMIEYSSNKYVQLESAGERFLNDGLYLSKLILNEITKEHAGFYACAAINYGGHKVQEAYLSVYDVDEDETEERESENSAQNLFLLFLIPLGFALAPLTMWYCYLLFRKRKLKKSKCRSSTSYVPVPLNRNNFV